MKSAIVRAAVGCTLAMGAAVATAASLPFFGSVTGVSSLIGADASCAPLQFRSVINASSTVGHSDLGDFTYGTSTCLSIGGALSNGSFTIDFGADSFSGTFDGGSTPSDTVGISDTSWLFAILSGTGRFAGASGTFEGSGLADARTRPTQVVIGFIGDINAPAVPEPTSWALMLLGFSAIGMAARRRRRPAIAHLA